MGNYVKFRKMRTQLFFSGCLALALDFFFPLKGIHASNVIALRREKMSCFPSVCESRAFWIGTVISRCNSYPCMQEFALGLGG